MVDDAWSKSFTYGCVFAVNIAVNFLLYLSLLKFKKFKLLVELF